RRNGVLMPVRRRRHHATVDSRGEELLWRRRLEGLARRAHDWDAHQLGVGIDVEQFTSIPAPARLRPATPSIPAILHPLRDTPARTPRSGRSRSTRTRSNGCQARTVPRAPRKAFERPGPARFCRRWAVSSDPSLFWAEGT